MLKHLSQHMRLIRVGVAVGGDMVAIAVQTKAG